MKIKVKKLIALIMALVLIMSVVVVGSSAAQKPAPLFTIDDVETRQSEEVDVTVKFAQDIKPGEINIAALDATLHYNSEVFSVVRVAKGEGLNVAFAKLENSNKLHLETGDYIYGASFKEEGCVKWSLSTLDGFTFEKDTDFAVITFKVNDFANLEGDNSMTIEVTNAGTKLEKGESKNTTALYTPYTNNVKVDINLATLCDWELDTAKKTYTLAKLKDKNATYFNVPAEYEDEGNTLGAMPVTKIKYGAFSSTSKLEEVVLPESVKTIDAGAFFNCSNLKKVTVYADDASFSSLSFLGSKSGLTIKCKKGSTADTFAKKNGISVEYFEDISNCKYTGNDEAKYYIGTPVQLSNLKIYNSNGVLLKEGKDYSLEYENNVEIGTATVHVIGAGEYPGTMDIQFKVLCPYHTTDSEHYTEMSVYEDCSKGGKLIKDCTICGMHEEEELPAKEHGEKEWKVTLEPTCQKEGKEELKCADCNVSFGERTVAKCECNMEMKYIKEPTCKETGEGQLVCTMCGRAEPKQELPIVGHDYQWVTTKEATCTEDGEQKNMCRFCGDVKETKVIKCAGSHKLADWVTIEEPTCTEDGYKQKVCSVCGEVVEKIDIPKLGHTAKEEAVIIEATCEKDGTSSKVCATCGEVLSSEVIPATGHKKSEWKVIDEPSCDKAGKEGIVCENCGLEYETKRIEPLTHEEGDEYVTIKEPTCTEKGIIGKVCKHCGTGKVYERKIVDPKGHSFGDWEYAVEPTCLEEGLRQRTCSACGENEIEIAPAKGHNPIYVPDVRPTYRTTGIEKQVCEHCGRDYHKTRVTPKVVPDLDESGTISSADALMILQHSVELMLLKDDQLKNADCNGDGNVNSTDALLVLQLATGIITAD